MKYQLPKKLFDLFLFSSLFISGCAVIMLYQTYTLILENPINFHYLGFVFFSTMSSYNFHWLLSTNSANPSYRLEWTLKNKKLQLFLFFIGLAGSAYYFFYLTEQWHFIGIAVSATFLYSAIKIKWEPIRFLKKIAIGKTAFLSIVWVYVTAVLPFIIEQEPLNEILIIFICEQFFFIYAICIIFDYRDRDDDITEGVRGMITYLNEKGINILFYFSIILAMLLVFLFLNFDFEWSKVIILLIPVIIVACIYQYAKKNFSDYLYYFILDGLMMFSGFLLWIMNLI